ncbi:cupin domain-containing protein [Saccharophagus sp. K07]|jgi:cupin 2 domain-containing protein|uniref:cupin domain-containing protein n=1 Tax=Saccharophagus sp. K07 TaxID=2283636 RepID=UPI001CA37D7C|nr:cupin domain-containing protein [Saccharophagus sp. K07]MBC6906541.1 cupin domain-containing protein [Saccharophagus sp. K07]
MKPINILQSLPQNLEAEVFEDIIRSDSVRIERIISKGHTSPECGWYDQEEHEWVLVLEGKASLEFEGGKICDLGPGDYLNIPAHTKHKVIWTDPDRPTVWLAVFYL